MSIETLALIFSLESVQLWMNILIYVGIQATPMISNSCWFDHDDGYFVKGYLDPRKMTGTIRKQTFDTISITQDFKLHI